MTMLIESSRETRKMIRNGGRDGIKRWAPPSPKEIQTLRKKMGLTQKEFADRFGFDVKSIKNWEQGVYFPEQTSCMLLAMIKADGDQVESLISKAMSVDMA